MDKKYIVNVEWARKASTLALTDHGVPSSEAQAIVEILLETSLLGVKTHGLRLLATYLDEINRGVSKTFPEFSIINDTGPVVFMDADGALGVSAGLRATRLAVERAHVFGIAAVGVRNSNHFGAAGAYCRKIAKAGFIGISTTSAAARVACFGGREPLFGTNPISVAFGDDFCLDMATSQVCYSEIKERTRTGTALEPGWAVDEVGRSISDASAMHALCPLGGYKGQGLAMSVTLLTSILMGGPLDWEMEHMNVSTDGKSRGVCHFFLAINPDVFGGVQAASVACESLVMAVRTSAPSDPYHPVIIPGDAQRAHKARQLLSGLELDSMTYAILKERV
ncbi:MULTISPECIES: Ldh family oxidoreductase [Pseudomonas]|uniref:Putative oxidoreductase YjmC n=1 Tax=Pseudomonas fluorescens TaxID=294 RepID=A0A5E7TAE9_PSEFL|nr:MULTISPECIES: Ldh family oxidoreductase [Pseudomonas]OPK10979.1 hypothetical protein BZ163_07130 [Pseudomonas sp. VI4.1]VVP95128.1 putative oxidoreductase YjmC [Pseudomonas fluorescens]